MCIISIDIDKAYFSRYRGFVLPIVLLLELDPVARGIFLVLKGQISHISVYVRCISVRVSLTLIMGVVSIIKVVTSTSVSVVKMETHRD